MTKVLDFEEEKRKHINEELENKGFTRAELEDLYEQENELSKKVRFYLSNLPEYKELVHVRDLIKHKSDIRDGYSTVVEKLSLKEQRKIMNEALRDIALNNIENCQSYDGDEDKYIEFINRIHGFKDEWKAFRRTNVDNFNYYVAKAKFMLDQYSYNYAILLVDAYKEYKRYLTIDESTRFIKGIGATILQKDVDELGQIVPAADKMIKKIKSKNKRDLIHRENLEQKYKKSRYRNLNYDEFLFRLECFRILNDAYEIPELSKYAALINYKYFCGASVVESTKFVFDFDQLLENRIKEVEENERKKKNKEKGIEEPEQTYTANEFFQKLDKYFKSGMNRGSVNNQLRNLEHDLAKYLISREKEYITGIEYFEKFKQVEKDLDEKDLMIEFAKTMERYKETTESLKNMTVKPPRKKKEIKKQ